MELDNTGIIGGEGLDSSIEKLKTEVLEKVGELNKQFFTSVEPVEGVYGVKEIVKPDGILEKVMKDAEGLYTKEYYDDGNLIKSRAQINKDNWITTFYDDNETGYLDKIYTRTETNSLTKVSESLKSNVEIVKGNFSSSTDSMGRVISAKMNDISIQPGRDSLNLERDQWYREIDDRGHLVPDIFGGPGGKENIVPELGSINKGEIKKVENLARKLKEEGNTVDYEMKVNYTGDSGRPSSFEPKITVKREKYELPKEFQKIYNEENLTSVDKFKTNVNETLNATKEVALEANKLGVKEGLVAAGLTLAVTTGADLMMYCDGEITAEDMAIDIVSKTAVAGGVGYTEGFARSAVTQVVKNSSNELISNLANTGVPTMVITFAVRSYDSVSSYMQGEIDALELTYDLGDNAAATVGGYYGAQTGAIIGTPLGPVGTVTGALVGGVVGTALASEAYTVAVDLGIEGAEQLANAANELGQFCSDLAKEHMPEFAGEITASLNEYASNCNLPFSFN